VLSGGDGSMLKHDAQAVQHTHGSVCRAPGGAAELPSLQSNTRRPRRHAPRRLLPLAAAPAEEAVTHKYSSTDT